jgi:hypothetical protein
MSMMDIVEQWKKKDHSKTINEFKEEKINSWKEVNTESLFIHSYEKYETYDGEEYHFFVEEDDVGEYYIFDNTGEYSDCIFPDPRDPDGDSEVLIFDNEEEANRMCDHMNQCLNFTGCAIGENGDKHWYLNSNLHREDGPAVELADGDKKWYLNDQLHREDGPAIELADGDKSWYLNGNRHRKDGPAIESPNGDKVWYLNDEYHREDGPAIEYANGDKVWFLVGKRHREDGPAIERADGDKVWFYNDVNIERKFDVKITSVEQFKTLAALLVFE